MPETSWVFKAKNTSKRKRAHLDAITGFSDGVAKGVRRTAA